MKIAILDDYQNVVPQLACFGLLKDHEVLIVNRTEKDVEKLALQLKDVEILVLIRERTKITEALLCLLPKLKLISQTGKIARHIDITACEKYGVKVLEGVGSPIAPAELTWALLMNVVRRIPQAIEGMKAGKWQVNIGNTVYGKTLGIWGYGKIGRRVAQYAKAFGAKVMIWGSDQARQSALEDGFEAAPSKQYFFERADIISLHLRLTDDNLGIVTASDLLMMKEGAALINTARAELIEEGSLKYVLEQGKNLWFGLDVFEAEPIYDKGNFLISHPQVICTPHLGYVEMNSYELYFGKAFENVLRYIEEL